MPDAGLTVDCQPSTSHYVSTCTGVKSRSRQRLGANSIRPQIWSGYDGKGDRGESQDENDDDRDGDGSASAAKLGDVV